MTVSYCGVQLHAPSGGEVGWAKANIDPGELWGEFLSRIDPGKGLALLPFWPTIRRPIELGVLHWPRGASRFAVYHGLVDSVQLAKIRTQVVVGSTVSAGPLVISDGLRSVAATMWMLPPRRLTAPDAPGDVGMWLATLVDSRYHWWERSAAIPVSGGTTTWESLYGLLGAALSTAITVDTIPGAYLFPPTQLKTYYEALPLLLDGVAASVGQRVAVNYDGTAKAQNGVNGLTQVSANLAAGWPKKAGGVLTPADLVLSLPKQITVSFPLNDTTLAPSTSVQANPSGAAFNRPLRSTFILSGDGSTNSESGALATQIAADWYALQLGPHDVVYNGVAPWVPDSLTDEITFTHTADEILTRATRGPWDDWPEVLFHRSPAVELNSTLEKVSGASLVPVGGYRGATGSSGDGTIGLTGDSSASGAWAIKDGLILKIGDLTINDAHGGTSHGTSKLLLRASGGGDVVVVTDNVGNATATVSDGGGGSATFTTLTVNILNVNDSIFFGSSATVNFNNVTIINFPPGAIAFHGARFPSGSAKMFSAGETANCTFSLAGGANYGAGGYDGDSTLIAGGTACTISVGGYYHFTASTLWNASATLCVIARIKTTANGGDVITKGVLRTTLGGTPDDDSGASLEISGDYLCAPGDTITLSAKNNDSVIPEDLLDNMLHFHLVP